MDRQDMQKLSALVKLEFTREQLDQLACDMTDMIAFVDKLAELDTEGIPPANHISRAVNVLRDDEVKPSIGRERILGIAPEDDGYGFVIPRVIG